VVPYYLHSWKEY